MTSSLPHIQECHRLLGDLLRGSGALFGIVMDRGGDCIASEGLTRGIDLTSIAALAAGAFASTMEMAKLIGGREFSLLFQQGTKEHLIVSLLGEGHLLLVAFDDRTTVGLVQVCAKEIAAQLAPVLEAARQQP